MKRAAIVVAGHRVSYLNAGAPTDPVILLLHGLMSDATTWDRAIEPLAARGFRVLALDLIGHGESDKPPSGYSLTEFAAQIRAFLDALGIETAVIGGHSLGGAIAIQFAHDHPDRTAGLILVCSGGLGRQVHPILRGATLPGARTLVRLAINTRTAPALSRPRVHRALRLRDESVTNLGRMGRSIITADGRHAFFETLHSVIEPSGQRGSMIEMGYLSPDVPTLIVWSEHDPIIPVAHARVDLRLSARQPARTAARDWARTPPPSLGPVRGRRGRLLRLDQRADLFGDEPDEALRVRVVRGRLQHHRVGAGLGPPPDGPATAWASPATRTSASAA